MKQYLELVRTILATGNWQDNRTGIRSIAIPGACMRFDLADGFPAVTTRRLPFKSAVGELIGFLRAYRSARDLVVLVAANLYLQSLAAAARSETARAQLGTAQALYDQAGDLRKAGMVAGIDVVRAEVRLSSDRQRATAAENAAPSGLP